MVDKHGCEMHSFDPIIEATLFASIRQQNPSLIHSPVLPVNNKWKFYKLGVSNQPTTKLGSQKIGDKLDLMSLLKLTGLENKVVDVVKIDIEGEEKGVIENLDMNYACKYFKQFLFETHKNCEFKDLVKLEECFILFHRHTRFFMGDKYNSTNGHISEFQQGSYMLNLGLFGNEINLAEFMFVTGEFYFLNVNFL